MRRFHRRRLTILSASWAAVAIVVVVVVLFGGVPIGPWSARPSSGMPGITGRYVDPDVGWSMRLPSGLYAQHFRYQGRDVAEGVRVTNFVPDLSAPGTGAPAMSWLRTFPATGVAVQIWIQQGMVGVPALHDASLPLDPASFSQAPPYVGGSEPAPRYRDFSADGLEFNAAVWIGPRASMSGRHAVWAAVRSLRFPALSTRTIWHRTYYVLGSAARFRVGAVTPFPASALPRSHAIGNREGFYLLRYPRGFYVIKQEFQRPVRPFAKCAVSYNVKAAQFSCPRTDLHWDRNGLPLGSHATGGLDWALPLHLATVTQGGQVVFTPFQATAPERDLPQIRRG